MIKIKLTLLLIVAVLILSSCGIIIINRGGDDAPQDTTGEETTYEIPEYPVVSEKDYEESARQALEKLPDKDFDGLSVLISAVTETGNVFSDTEGVYQNAVLRRNQLIADKYSTKVVVDYKSASQVYSGIKNASKSGDYFADFAIVRASDMGTYYSSGYIQNFKALSYTDLEAPYFNQQAIDQLTLNGVIYGVVGDLTEDGSFYSCFYYNKTLGSELGIDFSYSDVYGYSFTYDKLFSMLDSVEGEYAKLVSSDNIESLTYYLFTGSGRTYLTRNEEGKLSRSFVNDSSVALVSTIKKLLTYRQDKLTFNKTEVDSDGNESTVKTTLNGFDAFAQGRSLFAAGLLSDMSKLSNCGFDYEVLPTPKTSEEGEYYTAVMGCVPVMVLIKSSPNIDTNGYILQALGASSEGYMRSAFIKGAMRDHFTGIYSPDMIDLIMENPVYDHAYMFGNKYPDLKSGTYGAFYNAVKGKSSLSYYADKNKSALEKYLNTVKG